MMPAATAATATATIGTPAGAAPERQRQKPSVINVTSAGKCDTWATPVSVFERACEMCSVWPVLDVCATARTAKCRAWYGAGGERANGLCSPWDRPWWCNPPYSDVAKWVAKAHIETERRPHVPGMMLVYSKTDTAWWHTYVEGRGDAVRPHFWRGRIRFVAADGRRGKNTAPYPSVVLRFGGAATAGGNEDSGVGAEHTSRSTPRLESFTAGRNAGRRAEAPQ